MPLHGAKRQTIRDFEDALKSHEKLIKKLERSHIDMGFEEMGEYYKGLKGSAASLLEKGWGVSDLMEGLIIEDAVNRFIALLAYITDIADKPTLGRDERTARLMEVKNIYVMAKPIIISKHQEE